MVHPLSPDWIMFPPCRNYWGYEEITGWGASRGVQSPRPAQLPVLLPFFPPLGCMQATAAWVLPPGKSLPFAGIYPTPSAWGHLGEEGMLVLLGRRPFSQSSGVSYRVMQRIFICIALLSLLVPNLLQAEKMILGSGKLLVQSW